MLDDMGRTTKSCDGSDGSNEFFPPRTTVFHEVSCKFEFFSDGIQFMPKVPGAGVTVFDKQGGGFGQDRDKIGGDVGTEGAHVGQLTAENVFGDFAQIVANERRLTGQHLVQRNTRTVDIGRKRDVVVHQLFGRHVHGSSQRQGGIGFSRGPKESGHPKVQHFRTELARQRLHLS